MLTGIKVSISRRSWDSNDLCIDFLSFEIGTVLSEGAQMFLSTVVVYIQQMYQLGSSEAAEVRLI